MNIEFKNKMSTNNNINNNASGILKSSQKLTSNGASKSLDSDVVAVNTESDVFEAICNAQDRRMSWQQQRSQKSFKPSLSVICK